MERLHILSSSDWIYAPGLHKCPNIWNGLHGYSDLFALDLVDSLGVVSLSLQDTLPQERGSPMYV